MEMLTKYILNELNNRNTKIEQKQEYKGNYYNYMTNTIYLASDMLEPKDCKEISQKCARLIVICHECIHSVQKSWMHILNILLSHIAIILFGISVMMRICVGSISSVKYVTLIVISLSIIIRAILEVDAIIKSIELAKVCINKKIALDISTEEMSKAEKYIRSNIGLAILQIIFSQIVMFIIVLII